MGIIFYMFLYHAMAPLISADFRENISSSSSSGGSDSLGFALTKAGAEQYCSSLGSAWRVNYMPGHDPVLGPNGKEALKGALICTKGGTTAGASCLGSNQPCSNWRLVVWQDHGTDLGWWEGGPKYMTKAGHYYAAHKPCRNEWNLPHCGQWGTITTSTTTTTTSTTTLYTGEVFWTKGKENQNCMEVCGGRDECIEVVWPGGKSGFENILKEVGDTSCTEILPGEWQVNPAMYTGYGDNGVGPCYWSAGEPGDRCGNEHWATARYCPCKSSQATTTVPPTTDAPTTAAPTTQAPTTEAPSATTETPTTSRPSRRRRRRGSRRRKSIRRRRHRGAEKNADVMGKNQRRRRHGRRRRRRKASSAGAAAQ